MAGRDDGTTTSTERTPGSIDRRRLTVIFVIVFVDVLGFGLILPLLPYYATELGASPAVIGLLIASYAAAQAVGAPALGRMSDIRGRRPILIVSISARQLAS